MNVVELSDDKATVTFTDKRRINIIQDEYAGSPREWDTLSTILAFHKRYDLDEDKDCPCGVRDFDKELVDDYVSSIDKNGGVVFSLYMYDHSGISLSISPFSCSFDSGQLGFIYVKKEKLESENLDAIKDFKKISEIIKGEIDVYNEYLMGSVYRIIDNANEIDCGGYYGYDGYKSALAEIESLGLSKFIDEKYLG